MKNEITSLIARVLSGDESAFSEICKEYEPLLRSMSQKYAHMSGADDEKQVREDFLQEATLALYRAAVTYDEKGGEVSFGLYSKICIRNALVSELRRMSKKKRADIEQEKDAKLAAKNIPFSYDDSIVTEIFEKGGLSGLEREIFLLYVNGVKVRDIAQSLERSPKSVSNAIYRIKEKVRLYIGDL